MAGAAAHHCFEKDARQKKVTLSVAKASAAALSAMALFCAVSKASARLNSFAQPLRPAGTAGTAVPQRPGEDIAHLQERFDKENDGVRKARQLQKLGDAQFAREREATKSGDFAAAGVMLEKYRDNVRAALGALKKTHPQAEKHPGGYKELEFQVAQGLREVHDVILAMPEPYRPPMQIVEKDLQEMDAELLRLLFPRRPGEQPATRPPASSPKKDEPSGKEPPPEKQP